MYIEEKNKSVQLKKKIFDVNKKEKITHRAIINK